MKRKILALLMALVFCIGLAVPASAAPDVDFVTDEIGYLADAEVAELNKIAASIYDSCGVGIFFVYTLADDVLSIDVDAVVDGVEDYYVMVENNSSWFSFVGGKAGAIDVDKDEELRAVYDGSNTYVGGVEAFFHAAAACFIDGFEMEKVDWSSVATWENDDETAESSILMVNDGLVYDEADLLSSEEEAELNAKLQNISQTYSAEVVVATVSASDGSVDSLVEEIYDTMGFGYGENRDGVILLVCMNPREYRILSNGFVSGAIGSSEIESIGNYISYSLSDGDYALALSNFADECDYYLNGFINGFPFTFGKNLVICLLIGAAAGIIVALILKGQLKSVRKQNQANVYVKPGSMQISLSNDIYLYRNVTRTKKETKSSGSSGSSRSVGGGSF